MGVKTATQQATRRVVRAGVGVLGAPLTVVERSMRRVGIDVTTSYPARLMGAAHADVARLAGQITGDAVLTEQGRRRRERVESLRRAAMLGRQASEDEAAAVARLRDKTQTAERQHRAIDEAGRAVERARVAEEVVNRAAADLAARRDEEKVARRDEQRRSVEHRVAREARRTRLAEESAVVDQERAALRSEERADELAAAAERGKRRARPNP